jgi:hypothetical protein
MHLTTTRAVCFLLAATLSPQDERAALSALRAAEELAAKGYHAQAQAAYKSLARQHPNTVAGETALRRSQPNAYLGVGDIVRTGPCANRVDVVIMGDGYMLKHLRAFGDVARVVPKLFERDSVLGEYIAYHNFLRADVVSADDGLDAHGRDANTALGGRESGGIQGQCAIDGDLVRAMLAEVPEHDELAIVYVKQGVLGTGGGGIATIGGRGDMTTIHEWGHAFAELGDEYAQTTGHRGPPGEGINISKHEDPKKVPWRHWIEAKAPGVGVYQGANGQERGAFKPVASDCLMESGERFCTVCREGLVLRIHELVDPIDECSPPSNLGGRDQKPQPPVTLYESRTFEVKTLRPKSHALEVRWWLVPEAQAPATPAQPAGNRRGRGKLPAIVAKPMQQGRIGSDGRSRCKLLGKELAKGRWMLICRVTDPTRFADERLPWVLADPHELLSSQRAWIVVVE